MARRYPFAACEVLCCEVDAIFSALLDDPALLARLFGFLDAAGPLDCVRAGFFARSITCLLMRRHADVMRYLQTAPAVLDRLVAHVDTTSIAEVNYVGILGVLALSSPTCALMRRQVHQLRPVVY